MLLYDFDIKSDIMFLREKFINYLERFKMKDSVNELKKFLDEEETQNKKSSPQKWAGFVESEVINFFDAYKIEKLSLEDGNGNKAKLSRTKDNSIKIEYLSTVLM